MWVGSYLCYGVYFYVIVVCEYVDGSVVEYCFVGFFSVVVMNVDVLEILMILCWVCEVLVMVESDFSYLG